MSFKISKKQIILGALIVVAILVMLAIFVDWPTVIAQLRGANLTLLGIGTLVLILGYVVYAIRWHVLLTDDVPFIWTFHTANSGSLVNLLLPLRPGDAARILMLGMKDNMSVIRVTSSIVVERWYEQVMRIAAIGGTIVFGAGLKVSTYTILGSFAYLIIVLGAMIWMVRNRGWVIDYAPVLLAKLPRVNQAKALEWIHTLLDGLASMAKVRSQAWTFLWSVACWSAFWAYHYITLIAIFPDIPIEQALGISLGSLALVPPSATTLPGVYQVSLIIPLTMVGFNRNVLGAYAVALNIVEMIVVLVLGFWGVAQIGIPLRKLLDVSLSKSPEPIDQQRDPAVGN